jgi:hypothetical protein
MATPPLTDIDPSMYALEMPGSPSPIGERFVVEIHLRGANAVNVPAGVQGVEVHFRFSGFSAYAKPVAFENKLGGAGGVLLSAPILYGINPNFYDDANDPVLAPYVGATQFAVAAAGGGGWNGDDGLVATLTFEIINEPDSNLGEPAVTFPMSLTLTDIVDASAIQVVHTRVDGQLKINPRPIGSPNRPFIFVDPTAKTGTMGEIFTAQVQIAADTFWDVAGFDVMFTYDPTHLAVVGVAEGGFLKQHSEATYGWIDTTVPGEVWTTFTKLENPAASGGTDTLFTVNLQVIYRHGTFPPPTSLLGFGFTDLASWPHPERLYEPWEGGIMAVQLPYDADSAPPADLWSHYTIGGTYTAPYMIQGPDIDAYTQYPVPYAGRGKDQHSDAFAPQSLVCLYAEVTYGGDRVANKFVVFEIHNAVDEKVTILQNYSDISGIASVCFRIPQTDLVPGGEDPAIFGWWWIIATVELDQIVVNDTLTFQVGWLIEVDSVTAVGAPYRKYVDSMTFDVVVSAISEQARMGLLVVDAFDAESYPIGEGYTFSAFHAVRVASDPHGTVPGLFTCTFSLGIPTWCKIGSGTVRAVVLTDWPGVGGTVYCPTISSLFGILEG